MSRRPYLRNVNTIFALGLILALAACAQTPNTSRSPTPQIGNGYPENLDIVKPGSREVVVVINDNVKMVHSGLFAAGTLLDPGGSYTLIRDREPHWQGTTLQDYVRFQLDDGPVVKLYRFTLPPEQFAQIKERIDSAGATMPLFCAAKVQNILSGIAPFESVPNAWFVAPATLARYLDRIIDNPVLAGACYWPNGASCNPRNTDISLETSSR
jgi:hypothetical protein